MRSIGDAHHWMGVPALFGTTRDRMWRSPKLTSRRRHSAHRLPEFSPCVDIVVENDRVQSTGAAQTEYRYLIPGVSDHAQCEPRYPRILATYSRNAGAEHRIGAPDRSTGSERRIGAPDRSTGSEHRIGAPDRSTGSERRIGAPDRSAGSERTLKTCAYRDAYRDAPTGMRGSAADVTGTRGSRRDSRDRW